MLRINIVWQARQKLRVSYKLPCVANNYARSEVRNLSSLTGDENHQVISKSKSPGFLEKFWGKESCMASPSTTSRWLMTVPAVMSHLCIGSPYAWSLMADIITRENGFVAAAASDWTLMQAALPLSIVFVTHGLTASLSGK